MGAEPITSDDLSPAREGARCADAPGTDMGRRTGRRPRGAGVELAGWPLAATLGWLGVGLGLAALIAPRAVGACTGLDGRSGTRGGRARVLGAAAVVGAIGAIGAADLWASIQRSRSLSSRWSPLESYLERSVIVNKTPRECYDFWRDPRNIPAFTPRLKSVTRLGERRSHWVMRALGDSTVEWDSIIAEDSPGERIVWHSAPGSWLSHAGSVNFRAAPGGRGTYVTVSMHYRSPAGALGARLARLLGPDPFGAVRENLRRFKQLMETGEIATTIGQPCGRRGLLGRLGSSRQRSRAQIARVETERAEATLS